MKSKIHENQKNNKISLSKKKILLVAVLQFLMVLGGCSGDESQPAEELFKDGIKADFITVNSGNDFAIGTDNATYTLGDRQDEKGLNHQSLIKIDSEGKETVLKKFDGTYPFAKLTITSTGDVLLISKGNQSPDQDKILRFENNFSELNAFYTMKPISSPFASKINLFTICNNNDNTYFVFDYDNKNIKRVLPELNTDVFVAGTGKNEVKDGKGLEAGIATVLKIISLNKVLYFIDELRIKDTTNNVWTYPLVSSNIRKLEYINNEWVITTLISTTNENEIYKDIAFDSNNDLYVSVWGKGIYKLNLLNNTLSLFIDRSEVKIWTTTKRDFIDFRYINGFKFKNNDLYVLNNGLIKISDYQSKLFK